MEFAKINEMDGETPVGVSGQLKHRFNTFEYQDFYSRDLEEIDVVGLDDTLTRNCTITAMRYSNLLLYKLI